MPVRRLPLIRRFTSSVSIDTDIKHLTNQLRQSNVRNRLAVCIRLNRLLNYPTNLAIEKLAPIKDLLVNYRSYNNETLFQLIINFNANNVVRLYTILIGVMRDDLDLMVCNQDCYGRTVLHSLCSYSDISYPIVKKLIGLLDPIIKDKIFMIRDRNGDYALDYLRDNVLEYKFIKLATKDEINDLDEES